MTPPSFTFAYATIVEVEVHKEGRVEVEEGINGEFPVKGQVKVKMHNSNETRG